jgi:hypothetical protein
MLSCASAAGRIVVTWKTRRDGLVTSRTRLRLHQLRAGLAAQRLLDPDHAPSAADVLQALQALDPMLSAAGE